MPAARHQAEVRRFAAGGSSRARARSWRGSPSAALGLALVAFLPGCSAPPDPAARDVLLITIDTLRADHLPIYGYHRRTSRELERWFGEGAIFERAYATSSYTTPSTASVLGGRLPQQHRVRAFDQIFPRETKLLTELLPEAYRRIAFVSTRILSDDATGLAARFDHFDDAIGHREDVGRRERPAAPTTDAVLAWLGADRDPGPLFLWVHYKDPHAPYEPPVAAYSPRFRRPPGPSGLPPYRVPLYARRPGLHDPLDYVDRYDDEIAYVDAEIGRLLAGYARMRPIDDALVILTADHGETLVESRRLWFTHSFHVFEELVRVPLLLRGPGVRTGRFRALVSGIDVAPTVLQFVGAETPPNLPGRDLREPAAIGRGRVVFVESVPDKNAHQWRAAIRRHEKWMVRVRPDGVTERVYYDLRVDPGERRPLPWPAAPPKPALRLLALVERDPDPAGRPLDVQSGRLREERDDLLRKLGYLEQDPATHERTTPSEAPTAEPEAPTRPAPP